MTFKNEAWVVNIPKYKETGQITGQMSIWKNGHCWNIKEAKREEKGKMLEALRHWFIKAHNWTLQIIYTLVESSIGITNWRIWILILTFLLIKRTANFFIWNELATWNVNFSGAPWYTVYHTVCNDWAMHNAFVCEVWGICFHTTYQSDPAGTPTIV